MFNVQRFAANDEGSPIEHNGSGNGGKHILQDLVERAKKKVKRARVEQKSLGDPRSLTADSPANDEPDAVSAGENVLGTIRGNDSGAIKESLQEHRQEGRRRRSRNRDAPASNSSASRVPLAGALGGDEPQTSAVENGTDEDSEGGGRRAKEGNESNKSAQAGVVAINVGEEMAGLDKPVTTDSLSEDDRVDDGRRPMEEVAEEWGLDTRLRDTLQEQGVKHFFPIQIKVVPDIVATERHSHVQSRDLCVCAPTGSGKTLVFVLGVLQALMRRRVVRLRALVLLPSRDLAMQVHEVFLAYAKKTGLRVGLAIGQTNFQDEQLDLVGAAALAGARSTSDQVDARHSLAKNVAVSDADHQVDILVATPGRLLDHLEQTPGFTLQHLRYLVIDEADRLLNQSYQGWVGKVIKAAYRREAGAVRLSSEAPPGTWTLEDGGRISELHASSPRCPRGMRLEPVTIRGRPLATGDRVRGPTVSTPPLRKLLFSATLTSNPQKLAGLDVVNALTYTAKDKKQRAHRRLGTKDGDDFAIGKDVPSEEGGSTPPSQETQSTNLDNAGVGIDGKGRFSTPATLEESYTVCDAQAKPLVLLSVLRDTVGRKKLLSVVFTSSVDSTHRLFRLLQLFGGFDAEDNDAGSGVAEFSSSLDQRQRSRIIRRAKAGAIRVIVCSDGMARGMDLESVGLVVNYDVPSQAKTYVHRVGRTARAGSRGKAVTLAKKGQVRKFQKMRAGIDERKARLDLAPSDQARLEPLSDRYQRCLEDLKDVLEAEKTGELDPAVDISATDAEIL